MNFSSCWKSCGPSWRTWTEAQAGVLPAFLLIMICMRTEDFLFGGLRTLKDEDGVVYVHAKDFPILVRRLELLNSSVFGVDVVEFDMRGRLVYRDTFIKRSRDEKWYTRAYLTMLRKYPQGWFSPTYTIKSAKEELISS